MDWKNLFKTVGKLLIEKKLGESENAAIATVVLGAILDKIHSKQDNPVVVQPTPVPPPIVAGPPVAPPIPVATLPDPDALRVEIMSAEHWARRQGGLYGIGALRALRDGSGPAQPGDRIHMDITPSVGGRDFQPGGPENIVLLTPGVPEQEAARLIHHFSDSLSLESEYDGGGTTPVLRVNVDFVGEETVFYQAEFPRKDGQRVFSNRIEFRIKQREE